LYIHYHLVRSNSSQTKQDLENMPADWLRAHHSNKWLIIAKKNSVHRLHTIGLDKCWYFANDVFYSLILFGDVRLLQITRSCLFRLLVNDLDFCEFFQRISLMLIHNV
jgi:hypothetical protein